MREEELLSEGEEAVTAVLEAELGGVGREEEAGSIDGVTEGLAEELSEMGLSGEGGEIGLGLEELDDEELDNLTLLIDDADLDDPS
jgi:hypothetical protein